MPVRLKDAVVPVEMLPGVVRATLAVSDKLMIVEFRLTADVAVPMHQHPHEQCGTVRKGRMLFTVGDEETLLGPGDSYSIPGGVEHGAKVLEDSLVIDVFTPPREDYL